MKLSIITCSFNCLDGLKAARAQVLAQQGVEIEHLIIDGGSTDGTKEWLKEMTNDECRMSNIEKAASPDSSLDTPHSTLPTPHSSLIWISEPDKGLYDALNKGLRMATGDVIGVLHTDDLWEHDQVLAHVAEAFRREASLDCGSFSFRLGGEEAKLQGGTFPLPPLPPLDTRHSTLVTPDAVYGDLYYVDTADTSRIRRVWRSGAYHPLKWSNGWMPPHTALFVRREAALRVGEYLTDHGSAADYEWMLRAGLVQHLKMVHLPEVLLRMRVGGVSNASVARRLDAHKYDQLAWTRNGLKPKPWTLKMKLLRKLPQWLHARLLRTTSRGDAALDCA